MPSTEKTCVYSCAHWMYTLYLLVGFEGVSHADRGSVLNSCCGTRKAKYCRRNEKRTFVRTHVKNARIILACFRHLSGHLSWAIITNNCFPNVTPLCTNFPRSQKLPTTKHDRCQTIIACATSELQPVFTREVHPTS